MTASPTPSAPDRRRPALLILVRSDPHTQAPRVNEAIRVAAGLAAGQAGSVTTYLHEAAVLALDPLGAWPAEEAVLRQAWSILRDAQAPVRVQPGAPARHGLGEAALPFEEIDLFGLNRLLEQATHVLNF